MTSPRHRLATLLLVGLALVGCTGGSDGDEGGEGAHVPDGWQAMSFPGGTVAVPPDWEEADPLGSDDLTAFGPERDAGPPPVLRVQVTDRDAVPFEELPGLAGTSLVAQFGEVEPAGEEDVEVEGAEEALVADFRYEASVDDEDAELHERMLIAWFDGDRQLQLRAGGPTAAWEDDREVVDGILATVSLDG